MDSIPASTVQDPTERGRQMTTTTLPEVEVIPVDGRIRFVVQFLIEGSSLADKVSQDERPAMIGNTTVLELRPAALPFSAWSTGEQLLWQFIASLAGKQAVNLGDLANYFRGSPESHRMLAAFATAFDGETD